MFGRRVGWDGNPLFRVLLFEDRVVGFLFGHSFHVVASHDTPFGKFARLQIVTIEDLFAGKKPAMPPEDPAAFKRAAREEDKTRQAKLI